MRNVWTAYQPGYTIIHIYIYIIYKKKAYSDGNICSIQIDMNGKHIMVSDKAVLLLTNG